MSVDEFTEIEDPEIFGRHFVKEQDGHFVVKSSFFTGMARSYSGSYQGKKLILFEDENFRSYQVYSLKNGKYLVFRRAVHSGLDAEERLSCDESREIDGSYPEDLDRRDWKPSDTGEELRDLYETGSQEEDDEF